MLVGCRRSRFTLRLLAKLGEVNIEESSSGYGMNKVKRFYEHLPATQVQFKRMSTAVGPQAGVKLKPCKHQVVTNLEFCFGFCLL